MRDNGYMKWIAAAGLALGLLACGPGGDGQVCPANLVECADFCVDTRYDPNHCGGCGAPCVGDDVCSNGLCQPNCAPGWVECNGACVDPNRNSTFCGAVGDCVGANAGVTCGLGEVCNGSGVCQVSCQAGNLECDGTCVNPLSDEGYCGASADCLGANAGVVCAAGEVCDGAGACRPNCQDGLIDCNGTCIDPSNHESYCGATADCQGANAGAMCANGELCVDSACQLNCPGGTLECGGNCVDPQVNPNFCGATGDCLGGNAGQVCGANEFCSNGTCASS